MRNTSSPDILTLQTTALSCDIALHGAELRSLRDAVSKDEFIWQRDPDIWVGSAPILFPVIGRLKDGGYMLDREFYEIPKHGFARDMDFSLVTATESSLTVQLIDSETTKSMYPYAFLLEVSFTLADRTLAVEYRVVNRGDRSMPFALGSHPAFNLPETMGPLDVWSILFDKTEAPVCYRVAENLLSSRAEPFAFTAANAIGLSSELFARDALIFKNLKSRRLQIVHRDRGVRVDFDTGGATTLGIWAKPGAPYVCLEPWCGFDDTSEINADIYLKPGILRLDAGRTFTTGYRISV